MCYAVLSARQFLIRLAISYFKFNQEISKFFQIDPQTGSSLYSQAIHNLAQNIGNETGHGLHRAINSSMGGTMKGVNRELAKANPQMAFMQQMPQGIQSNPILSALVQKALGNVLGASGNGKTEVDSPSISSDPNAGMWG